MENKWWLIEDEETLHKARISNNYKKKVLLQKKLYIFDQDGTTYLDFKPLPGAREIVAYLMKKSKSYVVFISNNSSKSTYTYQKKLSSILDISISENQIYTSTLATIQYLKLNGINSVYAVGTPDFEKELMNHGIELNEENPELVIVAFDTTLTYEKLKKACLFIRNGIEYVATHPDKVCPTQEGYIPDTGSFIALIETATDVKPKKILGKPNPDLINFLLDKFNLSPSDAIIFGDRLYTDILMGKNSNITTALMLTGESKIKDIEKYGIIPDFVFINFEEVLQLLRS